MHYFICFIQGACSISCILFRENAVVPKSNIIEYEPSDDLKKQNHYMSGAVQTMYIMADLNPAGK